nr:DNA-formamidopyrimidine glycosylase family protein [Halobacteriovorax sp. HLS]
MPELPEVETIKNQINEILPLKVISCTQSSVISSIAHTPIDLSNRKIIKVHRKGKLLYFELDKNEFLLSHLGMTGGWRIGKERPSDKIGLKHNHLCIKHSKGYLSYIDPRRFGHMYQLSESETQDKLAELGHDLRSKEFSIEYLTETIKKYPNRQIKVHLLDQSLYAGTGNYIVNEICARAFVRPTRRNKSLTLTEIKKMHSACKVVLDGATQTGGTTFQGGYADTTGSAGGGVGHLVVFYQKICQLCGETPVKKIFLAQRGTYYCPKCQK